MTLAHIFGGGASPLTWWEMTIRAVVAFVYSVAVVRIFGRRIFARWSALDVVIAVTMGSTISRAITGPIAFWPAIFATTFMIVTHRIIAILSVRFSWLSFLVEGRGVLLARDGLLRQSIATAQGVTEADVREALRAHGLESVAQTSRIVLEPNGLISVKRRQAAPGAGAAN